MYVPVIQMREPSWVTLQSLKTKVCLSSVPLAQNKCKQVDYNVGDEFILQISQINELKSNNTTILKIQYSVTS